MCELTNNAQKLQVEPLKYTLDENHCKKLNQNALSPADHNTTDGNSWHPS